MNKYLLILATFTLMAYGGARAKLPIEISDETYILAAMDAQVRQKHEVASNYFKHLYKKTGQKEFLYDSIRMYESHKDSTVFANAVQEALNNNPEDTILQRFHLIALLKAGKYSEASLEASKLSAQTKESSDYLLHAEALLKLGNYEGGCLELNKAYAITFDEETAERIALFMYTKLGKKAEAIHFLKDHISAHGNSKRIGKRLGSLYADSGSLEDAAQIYESTYELANDPDDAKEAVRIYVYQQNLPKLSAILEKSGVNDPLLIELYVRNKEFKKASILARTMYKREANPLYLAQSSVFTYEAATDHNDTQLLKEVIDGLTQANKEIEDPVYLNYLGYLMIDHDLDVNEGMMYVQKALTKQPESAFYLDSLAWGNYKLGKCAEAKRLIKQVESMIGAEEQEVKDHLKAIQQCKSKENK